MTTEKQKDLFGYTQEELARKYEMENADVVCAYELSVEITIPRDKLEDYEYVREMGLQEVAKRMSTIEGFHYFEL